MSIITRINAALTAFAAAAQKNSIGAEIKKREAQNAYNRQRGYKLEMDISKLRRAVQTAELGPYYDRFELNSIYKHGIDNDNHWQGAMENLEAEIMEEPIVVIGPNNQIDWDKTDLLADKQWFYTFCKEVLNTRYWGTTVLEVKHRFGEVQEIEVIDRLLINPMRGLVMVDPYNISWGIDYRNGPFAENILEFGTAKALGKAQALVKNAIFKYYAETDWAMHSADFYIPWVAGFFDSSDKAKRDEFVNNMTLGGTRKVAALDKDDKIQVIHDPRSNVHDMYLKRIDYDNSEMSKGIMGNTESMDSSASSGYAQAQVHERRLNSIQKMQMRLLRMAINSKLLPFMDKIGNPDFNSEYRFNYLRFWIEDENKRNGNFMNNEPVDPNAMPDNNKGEGKLMDFYHMTCSGHEHKLAEGFRPSTKKYEGLLLQIANALHEGTNTDALEAELIALLGDELTKAMFEGTGKSFLTADFNTPDWELLKALEENIYVFSGFKTHEELQSAKGLLIDPTTNKPRSLGAFRKQIKVLSEKYNNQYLRAEYSFAVQSSNSAARWSDDFGLKDTHYGVYRTARDGQVRPQHAAINGVVLPLDDPFWQIANPPNGWNCRCIRSLVSIDDAKPTDSATAYAEADKALTQIGKDGTNKLAMFRINFGQERVVFPPTHPYYNVDSTARQEVYAKVSGVLPDRSTDPKA